MVVCGAWELVAGRTGGGILVLWMLHQFLARVKVWVCWPLLRWWLGRVPIVVGAVAQDRRRSVSKPGLCRGLWAGAEWTDFFEVEVDGFEYVARCLCVFGVVLIPAVCLLVGKVPAYIMRVEESHCCIDCSVLCFACPLLFLCGFFELGQGYA